MKRSGGKVSTDGDDCQLGHNPFAGVADVVAGPGSAGLAAQTSKGASGPGKEKGQNKGKGQRLEVRRLKAGRGGKTVIAVSGFTNRVHATDLLGELKRSLGRGGTLKEGGFEVQGDCLGAVMDFLSSAGHRPVKSGG